MYLPCAYYEEEPASQPGGADANTNRAKTAIKAHIIVDSGPEKTERKRIHFFEIEKDALSPAGQGQAEQSKNVRAYEVRPTDSRVVRIIRHEEPNTPHTLNLGCCAN